MARPKKTNKKSVKPKKAVKIRTTSKSKTLITANPTQKLNQPLKISESYISLLLGAIVVIGISVIFIIFVKESRSSSTPPPPTLNQSISPVLSRTPERTYIILQDETLWDVAVKFYGDGFRYVEIIEANNLENPDYVPPGTKIIVPDTN